MLVFEDLHWIDSETQTLLDGLVESLPTAQLLLLVNYRPEYTHSWGNKSYYTQLQLDALPPESSDELLEVLLGDDASLEPLKTLLIERTQGNPFFLEESVRTLVETQVLVGEAGTYRLTQDLPSIQVPPTVQAVLSARIDRLSQDEKSLLQTAAVIGTEVPLSLLQAIAEIPEETLYPSLSNLQAVEFLYETSLYPERVYTFKHALTHEVTYGSLLQDRRRVLHARIMEMLEDMAGDRPDEQIERLAYHALRGEEWGKALAYCRQAGDKAVTQSAHREAVEHFEQALAAIERLSETREITEQAIDLRFVLRASLQSLGELARIPTYLQEAEELAKAINDQHRLAFTYVTMGQYSWLMGNQDRYIELTQRALAIAEPLGDFAIQVRAAYYLGTAYQTLGDYPRAIDYLQRVGVFLEKEPFWKVPGSSGLLSVVSRLYLSWSLAEIGALTEGNARAEEALRIANASDFAFSQIAAYFAGGLVALRLGRLDRAMSMLERGLGLCRSATMPFWFPRVGSVLGLVYALVGRVTEGLPLLEQSVEQGVAMRQMVFQPLWVTFLAEAYLISGHIENASIQGERALSLAREQKERGHQAYVLRFLGNIAMHRDPPDINQAEAHYQQALALASELGMRPLQAHCHRGLGNLCSQTGQAKQARAELATAIEMYRDMEMTFWLPETEAALAEVEGQ